MCAGRSAPARWQNGYPPPNRGLTSMISGVPSALSRKSTSIGPTGLRRSPSAAMEAVKTPGATVVATSVSPPLMRSLRRARTPSRLPSPSSEYTPSTPYSAPGRSSCTTTASRPFELALPSPPFADFADSDTASPRSAAEAKQRPVEPLPKRCLTMNRPFGFAARTLSTSLPSHVAGEGSPRCVSAEAMRCLSKTMVCAPDSRAATMHPVLRSSSARPVDRTWSS